MKKTFKLLCLAVTIGLFTACGDSAALKKSYNEGINIIPMPVSLAQQNGTFVLSAHTAFYAPTDEAKKVAAFFIEKLKASTGYELTMTEEAGNNTISIIVDPELDMNAEGYKFESKVKGVVITAKTEAGAFYGMQTFLQLLPAEVESREAAFQGATWSIPAVTIEDAPRYAYRGVHLDPCRHFITVENTKKQIDVMAMLKINRMHWHLTEDQGWRLEIKKYPKLTEVGATRIEGEGNEYKGFYTQEEIKDIVAYAAERHITVVPELEVPGHELAAIAAYPHLSCTGQETSPRIIWGVEDIVMCPGKGDMFKFLEDVVEEMVALFPSTYFHIGGDECPKASWKKCPACQALIRREGLRAANGHTAEERLQSYVIGRMETMLAKHGRRIIGWDEILEGGLSPDATVMSWRGEEGGIAAALQSHDVIMTPGSGGLYLDHYQGDSKIEPVTIGGYSTLEKTYSYNPTPDTLVAMGKEKYVVGVQCNNWSEYMYTNDLMEYLMYPRTVALAEIAWTPLARKDYKDFERRINNAYVRLDQHGINYHIPQPEQTPYSYNHAAFTDSLVMAFKTTRPITMVYTLDGTDPTPQSAVYAEPFKFTETTTLKIRSVLPSGKMSPVRTINIEKQAYAPAKQVAAKKAGLAVKKADGKFLNAAELSKATGWQGLTIRSLYDIRSQKSTVYDNHGIQFYGAIATGYVDIPEDGVYFFSSNNDQVFVDGKLLIDNTGEVKRFCRNDAAAALAKGLHEFRVIFCGNIIGGWPTQWDDGSVLIRKAGCDTKFEKIKPEQLFH